jgi:hypothetical protein
MTSPPDGYGMLSAIEFRSCCDARRSALYRLTGVSVFVWMGMAELTLTDAKESAKAQEAFAEYVALGPHRSLAKLAQRYAKNGKTAAVLRQLEYWSSDFHWQDRLKQLAAEQLTSATELKTTTYVNILGEYHRRISDEPRRQIMELNALHGIYDRVKPETPQSSGGDGSHITVNFAFVEVTKPQ